MLKRKIMFVFILFVSIFITFILLKKKNYKIENSIISYNIKNEKEKNDYLNYIKKQIKPQKLQQFVDIDFIYLEDYNLNATGNTVLYDMIVDGYQNMFLSMFSKHRVDFNDCPVTENFKANHKENLLYNFDFFGKIDERIDCVLYYDENKIVFNHYFEFKNNEPTKCNTYYFHYLLDDEGNVYDIIFE